jgi:transcriptional regulator with XRE-family HTH domain
MAEKLDVLVGYVARIEGGRQNLTIESLVRMALILRVDVSELFSAPATRGRRRPGRPKKTS